jgi:hypothetical protein
MRRKMKRNGIATRNESLNEAQDFRKICNYDSVKDDERFYVDEELGFQKAPNSIDRGHLDRKVLFLKVFDELEIFVVLYSSPLEN